LLVVKEQLKSFYQKYSIYLEPIAKFLTALVVFTLINKQLGFNPRLCGLPIVLILSTFCAFTPSVFLVVLAMLLSIGHILAISKILAGLVAMVLLIMYCFFSRLTPKFGHIVIAVPILYFLKIPYCVPILLGLMASPIAIIPVACGTAAYFLIITIKELTSATLGASMEDIINLVRTVVDGWMKNPDMIFAMTVFCIVLVTIYIIRKQDFNYSFEIAIMVGAVVNILGFFIGNLGLDIQVNLLEVLLGTIGSALIAYIVWFFRLTLDHTAIERIQFEDDDYYYYVKAVPKMKVTPPEKSVKKINEKKETT
ncbi:MAG: hypothetical protein RR056_05445, partial [Acetivibrio sp.]